MANLFSAIGFTTPWLLWSLLALPVLWFLLRAVPPAPVRRLFPGVILLLGLRDDDSITDKTPWWLILLRMLAAAAIIIGLAGPIVNPNPDGIKSSNPFLLVFDGSWAGAPDWDTRLDLADQILEEAERDSRTAAVLHLSTPQPIVIQSAGALRPVVAGMQASAWHPSASAIEQAQTYLAEVSGTFDTVWFSDGLSYANHSDMVAALARSDSLQVYQTPAPVVGLLPPAIEDGNIVLRAHRSSAETVQSVTITTHGLDPTGAPGILATGRATFEPRATLAELELNLPSELRARITRFAIAEAPSAGAVSLSDDRLRRREVALVTQSDDREGLELLSPLHYLHQALSPSTDLLQGDLLNILPANPDVVVLADVAQMTADEEKALTEWTEAGGLLLRFAGPRLAASDLSRSEEHPLMPVRLRSGGRSVGGAMSWGAPKTLAPFAEDSPFYGLPVPADVNVASQVVAQPDPQLANRVIAELSDGTPLVTRKPLGQGRVVLFHVAANAEWSSVPLSGLFVQMLDRLAVSSFSGATDDAALDGTIWQPLQVLEGSGRVGDAGTLPGVRGEDLLSQPLGPALRPGLYQGPTRQMAVNVLNSDTVLTPAVWPASVALQGFDRPEMLRLGGYLLGLAVLLLAADVIAALALSGRLSPRMQVSAIALAVLPLMAPEAKAQDSDIAGFIASELVLAYVLTGDRNVDGISRAGLQGLSDVLFFRTSVEPDVPVGVDLERDELAFFPLLYWPITTQQSAPSSKAYEKLNRYIRSGGMILFDTRDADVSGFGTSTPNGRKLQQLAQPLAIPPLSALPGDHVLTRAFYLLQDFPGRHTGREIWVEAPPVDAEQIEGMPFRNLNDGVTPVVIGGNDWAAAWAVDDNGDALFPIGRGFSGERQRELSYRFGINLVMHVLTGNYKSDQVHVPALLDRLGQ